MSQAQKLLLLNNVEIGSGTHTASYSMGTKVLFGRQSGWEVNHSPPLLRLRSGGAVGVPILPVYGFMVCPGAN